MNIIDQFNNDIMENCFFADREGQESHQQKPFLCVNPAMLAGEGAETRLEPALNSPMRNILNVRNEDNYYRGFQDDLDNAESINSVLNEFTTGIVDADTDAFVGKSAVISPDNGTVQNFSIPSLSNMINDAAGTDEKRMDENSAEASKGDKSRRVLDRKKFADVSKVALQRLDDAKKIFLGCLAHLQFPPQCSHYTAEIIRFHLVPKCRRDFNAYVKQFDCMATFRQISEDEKKRFSKSRKSSMWFGSVTFKREAQDALLKKCSDENLDIPEKPENINDLLIPPPSRDRASKKQSIPVDANLVQLAMQNQVAGQSRSCSPNIVMPPVQLPLRNTTMFQPLAFGNYAARSFPPIPPNIYLSEIERQNRVQMPVQSFLNTNSHNFVRQPSFNHNGRKNQNELFLKSHEGSDIVPTAGSTNRNSVYTMINSNAPSGHSASYYDDKRDMAIFNGGLDDNLLADIPQQNLFAYAPFDFSIHPDKLHQQ